MNRRDFIISWVFFLTLFVLSIWLAFFLHKEEHFFSWKGPVWADKAGYYIYLPATFLYQFDAENAPDGIAGKTGDGFILSKEKNKIVTKYTYGVSLLLTPFFLTVHGISLVFDIPEQGGFSTLYQQMFQVAAVFYLILGLFFLKKILSRYFSSLVQYLVLILTYFGTNLLYYTVDESLMSHVYSFFLFSLYLYGILKLLESKKYHYFLLLALAGSMAIVVRPANLLILLLLLFWDVTTFKEFRDRLILWIQPRYLIPFIMILSICILPQVIYWHYISGHLFYYSYGNEGFIFWLHPRIVEVWFAPLNVLFIFTPLAIIMIAGMITMIVKKQANGLLLFIIFLTVSYLCASWHSWYFGSSFGQRSFVEYYVLFSIPLGFVIQKGLKLWSLALKILGLLVLMCLIYFNIRMTLAYEKCFVGSTWDWDKYLHQVSVAGLLPFRYESTSFCQDFENHDLVPADSRSKEVFHSGSQSGTFTPSNPFCGRAEFLLYDIRQPIQDVVLVRFWACKPRLLSTGTDLECFMIEGMDTLYREKQPIDARIKGVNKWCEVVSSFLIPDLNQKYGRLIIQFRNKTGKPLYLDDICVEILK